MGLFQQRHEDQAQWAALPGEPLGKDPSDFLAAEPTGDLLGLGGASVSISIETTPTDDASS
jgi:hypothetical protein